MSPKAPKKRSKPKSAPKRAKAAMSREARATYAAIQKVVTHLEHSIGEIQRGLGKAEQKIQADARGRIRQLRKDARTNVSVLKAKQREAAHAVKHLSAAASGSWEDIKHTVDSILDDARATATSVVKRFRTAFGG